MHATTPALHLEGVSYAYGRSTVLRELSLEIAEGEVVAFLGPNGSGKTTLFRLISTLVPLQTGQIAVFGHSVGSAGSRVRTLLGVVFQHPAVDKKLTVSENLRYHAAMHGLDRGTLERVGGELLEALGLRDRRHQRVEQLSGGLQRRVELAKALLPGPRVLVLDEPTTGLDPSGRREFWSYLRGLREQQSLTIAVTTHALDEADDADRVAILDAGSLVAWGPPGDLRAEIGGHTIELDATDPDDLAAAIVERFQLQPSRVGAAIRLDHAEGPAWVPRLIEAFPQRIRSIRVSQPSLEDVFVAKTGRHLSEFTARD